MRTNIFFIILSVFIIFSCKETTNTVDKPLTKHEKNKESNNEKPNNTLENNPKQKELNQTAESTKPAIIKHGVKFTIPATWTETINEFKATDLKGNITSIQTDYTDRDDQSIINMVFYPGKKGQQLFDYKSKNLGKNSKQILINGKDAIQKIELLKTDGKGQKLDTPTKRIIISLLSDDGEMNFILNANSESSKNTFNHFISNLEFQTK